MTDNRRDLTPPPRGASKRRAAVQDDLPGPLSRRRMHQAIDKALTHLRDGGEPSAVLLVDVDVPDGSGERMPGIAAGWLAASLRPEDLVGHYGDDQFVVVARDVFDEAAAHKVAARLTRMLELPVVVQGVETREHLRAVLGTSFPLGPGRLFARPQGRRGERGAHPS